MVVTATLARGLECIKIEHCTCPWLEQAIENGIYFLNCIKVIILGRRESSVQLRLSPRSSAPAFRLPNILKKNMPGNGV